MFAPLTDGQRTWIADRCDELRLEPGEIFITPGTPADWMFIGLEGTVQFRRENLGLDAPVFTFHAGEIAGRVPFSRMIRFAGTGRAISRARIARFPATEFDALLREIPSLESQWVGLIADRVRDATQRDQEYQRFLSLGKMSAGIAHELNNPVSAAQRSAAELKARLGLARRATAELVAAGAGATVICALDEVRRTVTNRAAPTLDPLGHSEREDKMVIWLSECGLDEPWNSAGTFVSAGVGPEELNRAICSLPREACKPALMWLEAEIAADALVRELNQATARIADLIATVKTFTQMDRPSEREPATLASGLDTAVALFSERIAQKGVTVVRQYAADVPLVNVYVGELNRVWTALLANALEAVPSGGRITLRTIHEDGEAIAEVADTGPGVPEPIRDKIWEPFFTTKDVGQGAGLGLDVARRIVIGRHGGSIALHQDHGETVFSVRLPVEAPTG
jgi:signal transduction histidine kinase